MRYFIALEIPTNITFQIEQLQHQLKGVFPNIRLTDPTKLHLTIAFVGEQSDSLRESLVQVLTQATVDITPFTVTPAYIDGFPSLHHARILWMGVKGDIDKLMLLRERVKDGLISLGLESDERRYIPHIAIGKIDNLHLDRTREEELQQISSRLFAPIQIQSIKLFESIPQHGFHQHNTLAEVFLGS